MFTCVHNSCIGISSPYCRAIAGSISVLALTVIALSIIGLTAQPSGPFNALVQLGVAVNGTLLGTSIFVFILDMVWLGTLCKKKQSSSQSLQQPPPESALVFEGKEEFSSSGPFSNGLVDVSLPNEVLKMILSHLSRRHQLGCGRVNRRILLLSRFEPALTAFNPRNTSPLIKIFDASDWNYYVDMSQYGLTTKDMPDWDVHKTTTYLEETLASSLVNEIEADAGITLLTMPKGLTLPKLVNLASWPKLGTLPPPLFRVTLPYVLKEIGDIEVDNTYRIVITNNVLKGSLHLNSFDQIMQLNQIDCRKPTVLEAATLLIVTYMSSKKKLYTNCYTRCLDEIDGYPYVVGDFTPQGSIDIDYHHVGWRYGVGGVRPNF